MRHRRWVSGSGALHQPLQQQLPYSWLRNHQVRHGSLAPGLHHSSSVQTWCSQLLHMPQAEEPASFDAYCTGLMQGGAIDAPQAMLLPVQVQQMLQRLPRSSLCLQARPPSSCLRACLELWTQRGHGARSTATLPPHSMAPQLQLLWVASPLPLPALPMSLLTSTLPHQSQMPSRTAHQCRM